MDDSRGSDWAVESFFTTDGARGKTDCLNLTLLAKVIIWHGLSHEAKNSELNEYYRLEYNNYKHKEKIDVWQDLS